MKRLGASAAKLLVYYHPDAPNAADQERLVAEVGRRVPRGRPRAVPRAALVRAGRRQAAGRGPPACRRRDGGPADRAGRRHPQGGVPLRCRGDRRDPLGRGLRGAGRRDAGAVGAPLRWRRRRDVRAPGRGRVPRGRERRPGRADRCGRRRRRLPGQARDAFLAGAGRDRLARLTALVDDLAAPWRPRWTAARAPEPPGPGWYAAVLSPPPRCATSTCSSSASSTRTSSSRTLIPCPVFGQAERLVGDVRLTLGSSSAITACGAARLGPAGRDGRGRRRRPARPVRARGAHRPGRRHQRLPRRRGPAHGRLGRSSATAPIARSSPRWARSPTRARPTCPTRCSIARGTCTWAACSSSPGSP